MRVCIDIQAGVTQRAGIGRYTKELVQHLGPITAPPDEVRLFFFDFQRNGTPFAAERCVFTPYRLLPGRCVQYAWKRLNWPPFDRLAGPADVYHFPNFIVPPMRRGKTVVTIHDASFLRFPQFAEERNLAFLSRRIRDTVERADAIITDSRFGAAEVEELLQVPANRIVPIYPGIGAEFGPAAPDTVSAVLHRFGITQPYLLTVGTVEPRKNLALLLDVFERLPSFDGTLVIAGGLGWKCAPILERMRQSPAARRIRHLPFVDDHCLPALYTGAELFLCTSFYEGFGFPPLEAMACGTPVVSSAGGSLAEVLGDAALVQKSFDADAWAPAIAALLADRGRRTALSDAGRARARGFSWQDTARRTLDVYRTVTGLSHGPLRTP